MRIAIYGYGNLGRGVELAVRNCPDCALTGVFTRRDPSAVETLTGAPVYAASRVREFRDETDVMLVCAGSAADLPRLTPALAENFCTVDSFDAHASIPAHFRAVDEAARRGGTLCLIAAGWDPGLFSLARLYLSSVLPDGQDRTFWGPGISQGHSDAIRGIPGVLDARQYTVPIPSAMDAAGAGKETDPSPCGRHTRLCYVVAEEGADRAAIERAITTMPGYFAGYDTTVRFVSARELARGHAGFPHGGSVIRTGRTGREGEHRQTAEFKLRLDSNPEFTGSVLLAFARAVYRMRARGRSGCVTVFDVPPADLSPLSPEDLRAALL